MARGKHLFPFRTEKLSPTAPMVLGPHGPGRVGRRRFLHHEPPAGGSFAFRWTSHAHGARAGRLLEAQWRLLGAQLAAPPGSVGGSSGLGSGVRAKSFHSPSG